MHILVLNTMTLTGILLLNAKLQTVGFILKNFKSDKLLSMMTFNIRLYKLKTCSLKLSIQSYLLAFRYLSILLIKISVRRYLTFSGVNYRYVVCLCYM